MASDLVLSFHFKKMPVYTGACRTRNGLVYDDWLLFTWPRSRVVEKEPSAVCATNVGIMVPIETGLKYLEVNGIKSASSCVSCCKCVTRAWEYCEECMEPLCNMCCTDHKCAPPTR